MPARISPMSKFRHSAIIEIGGCPIGLAPSLKYLDAAKLENAEHEEIEVGTIEGTCCSRTVKATVEKGLVTGFSVEGCSGRTKDEPLHPEVQKLLKAGAREARKKQRARKTTLPVPVKTFLSRPQGIINIDCFCICVFGTLCYICCTSTDDPTINHCSPW